MIRDAYVSFEGNLWEGGHVQIKFDGREINSGLDEILEKVRAAITEAVMCSCFLEDIHINIERLEDD